jgi:hypothetical protein
MRPEHKDPRVDLPVTGPPLIFSRVTEDGERLTCPYFRCATCGRPVTDPQAIVVYPFDENRRPVSDAVVVHMGACDRFNGRPWEPLGDFLSYLVFNSNVSAERLRVLLGHVEAREAEQAREATA